MKKITIADNAYSARLTVFFDVMFLLITAVLFISKRLILSDLFVLLGVFVPTTAVHLSFLNHYLNKLYSTQGAGNLNRKLIFLFFTSVSIVLVLPFIKFISNFGGWPITYIGLIETIFAIYLIKVIFVKARGLP